MSDSALIPLSQSENEILKAVLDEDARIDVVVPRQIHPDTLWSYLETFGKAASKLQHANNKIRPIMGRILVVLKDYPEVWSSRGYTSYDNFLSVGMKELFGISRTECFEWRKVAENLPSLTIEDLTRIGTVKCQVLARQAKEGDKYYKKILEAAKDPEKTANDLRSYAATVKGYGEDEVLLAHITLCVTRETAKRWKEFIKDPMIQAYVSDGTNPAGESGIFARLLDEAEMEWKAQGEAILNMTRSAAVIDGDAA